MTSKAQAPDIPNDLRQALAKNAAAKKAFDAFSPSHQREYLKWIEEAKRDETRRKRIAATIEKLASSPK